MVNDDDNDDGDIGDSDDDDDDIAIGDNLFKITLTSGLMLEKFSRAKSLFMALALMVLNRILVVIIAAVATGDDPDENDVAIPNINRSF